MKKKLVVAMAMLMAVAMCACSNQGGTSTPNNDVVEAPTQAVQEEQPTVTEVIPPTIEETTAPTEDNTGETLEPNDQIETIVGNQNPASPFYNMERWVDTHGVTVIPPGSFNTMAQEYEGNNTYGDIEANHSVSFFESPASREGYKVVEIEITSNFNNTYTTRGSRSTINIIDAYTGYTFESGVPNSDGYITIEYNGVTYEIKIDFQQEQIGDSIVVTNIYVTCPEWYDGTTCNIGYDSLEKQEQLSSIDLSSRFYSLDELPYTGEGYVYVGLLQ